MSRLLNVIQGESVDRPPFWFMRQAGRYLPEYLETRAQAGSFLDLCFNPKLACEVTLQPIRRFDMDAAILFSDILVIPYALGVKVEFVKGEGPKLQPTDSPDAIHALSVPAIEQALAPVYETVSLIRSSLSEDKALIGFCGAPWTVATYMVEGGSSRDFKKTRTLALQEPEAFSHLMHVLVESSVAHLSAQIKAGAQVVQIFDSWAGILANEEFEQWCLKPIQAIIARLKQLHPDVPIIAFPKGAGFRYESFGVESGADVLGCDMSVPVDIMADLAEDIVVQGNIDPLLVAYDKPAMVRQAKQILDAMKGKPFIFNLGHGFIPDTPIDHVQTLCQLIREA